MTMKLSQFDYNLPKELIAQRPSEKRGDDRLLVVDKVKGDITEKKFTDIIDYFDKNDILVLNDTKVIPARLFGKRATGGKVEIFIIDKTKRPVEALVRPSLRVKDGEKVILESGDEVIVKGRSELGRFVEFNDEVDDVIKRAGHVPLPPYIGRNDEEFDRERYQTVFCRNEGALASPTAGLHFTQDMIDALINKGVGVAYVTLHVSYATFATIKEEDFEKHTMHSEYYRIDAPNAAIIHNARASGKRIIACGTTSVRVLESCADFIENFMPSDKIHGDWFEDGSDGFTRLFIYPGYKFRIVKAMITNFHLPKSSLLLLTSAFAGKDLLFKAYEYAVKNRFKFFSYGDAMLIL